MSEQSTRHIMMIEPGTFYANPQTMDTNHYQIDDPEPPEVILPKAVKQFRDYRDKLIEAGVIVSTIKGHEDCPDHVFPNWFSTHADGTFVLYPMVNENRRKERRPEMIEFLKTMYRPGLDMTASESEGKALESNGSLAQDRISRKVYSALSRRTDPGLVKEWARKMNYEPVIFETISHTGKPVYHVDIVLFIGTGYAGVCSESILPEDRDKVLASLSEGREIIDLTMEQMKRFAGNSLELLGHGNEPILVMSDSAYDSLRQDQIDTYMKYVSRIVHSDISVLEKYGGGSGRCMIQELY
jgi:hypothetical protein